MIYPIDALPQSEGLPFHEMDYSPGIPNDAKGENVHPQKISEYRRNCVGRGADFTLTEDSHFSSENGTEIKFSLLPPVVDLICHTREFFRDNKKESLHKVVSFRMF